jgi:hypothetical protein
MRRRQLRLTVPPLARAGAVATTPESQFEDASRGCDGRTDDGRSGLLRRQAPRGRLTARRGRRERSPASSSDLRDAPLTASPVPPRRPIIDPGAVRPESTGHIVPVLRRRARRSSRPRSVEVQTACLPEARLESGNRGDAAPVAPFGGTGAAERVLARVGPTTRMSLA